MPLPDHHPLLGVCLIVRDATETIEACLTSVRGCFDDIVIVDTGSEDQTEKLVAKALGFPPAAWGDVTLSTPVVISGAESCPRITLARFEWVDDFSAARNYSFALSGARWRGFLDSDDVAPLMKRLRPTLERTEREHPESNCIALPYDYADGELIQDKFRFVRWADGWRWTDEIHEYLVREPSGPRVVSKYDDLTVVHARPDNHTAKSLMRNIRICTAVRDRATAAGDTRKAGLMSYYLGQYAAAIPGHEEEAIAALQGASEGLGDTNLGCDARVSLARTYLLMGNADEALRWASLAAGRSPEHPEGHAMLGVVLLYRGEHVKAAAVFDHAFSVEAPPLQSSYDAVFMQGIVPSVAARAYAAVGRCDDALIMIARVPATLRTNQRVRPGMVTGFVAAWKAKALATLKAMWEFYVTCDESPKAQRLLENAPAMIADSPEVKEMHAFTMHRLRHVYNFADYRDCYNRLLPSAYQPDRADVDVVRNQGRMVEVRKWAEALPKEGGRIQVLSIGPQDCILERDLLTMNPRFHVTVSDVSDLADRAMGDLSGDFPGRVLVQKPQGFYDWPLGSFDAILFLEVVEHLPSQERALTELRHRLAPDGVLFLSTPVAGFWVCQEAVRADCKYDWFGHLHSNTVESLTRKIVSAGLEGNLQSLECGEFFFARLFRGTGT